MQALQCPLPLVAGDLRSRCEEEWPAYVSRGGSDSPRPILIFVAAEKNGPPAERHYHSAASILNFRARLANRCKVFPVYALLFCGVRPRESKLSTAWSPKRNQHRVCDADSLIIWVLR